MQLIYHPASPFARKAPIVAQEVGLGDEMDLMHVDLTIGAYNPVVGAHNPLGKGPTLITNDSSVLYDSFVICDYLDSRHSGRRLIPVDGNARWHVLRLHALADGIVEAGQLLRQETVVRAADMTNGGWMELQRNRIDSGLDLADTLANEFVGLPDLGQIALACAIGWLEFRSLATPFAG